MKDKKGLKMNTNVFGDFIACFCYPLWLQIIESWLRIKGTKLRQFRWQMRPIIWLNSPSCITPQCHQYAFLLILQVVSTWSCSWDLATQVVVVYQVDCSSGHRRLIGLSFVGCPASSGMEMHEWSCNWILLWCGMNMGFGVPRPGFREVPLPLNSCVTLGFKIF